MSPDGINVLEIGLNLPNTLYYLHWKPAAPPEGPGDHRALLDKVRATGSRMRWKILAAGGDSDAARLLFQTTVDNLEIGLTALLRNTRSHRLYLVQPASAIPLVAGYIHDHNDPSGQTTGGGLRASTVLPDIHYGLFMGERPWAERMLNLLTSCSVETATCPEQSPSLTEITRSHASSEDAIIEAYRSGRFSLKDIAEHFDMHFSEVSAVVNAMPMQERLQP